MDLPLTHEYVAPAEAEDEAPLIVVLHGRGADETDLLGATEALPDRAHLLSLRAPTALGPGYTWYELDLSAGGLQRSQPDAEDFADSRALLDESVATAVDALAVDPERVGLFGFSQGAVVSMASILERPSRYAWVAALHGYLPASHHDVERFDAAGRAAFVAAGEADEVIPQERASDAAERLEAAGLEVTYRTYATGHGIGPDEHRDVVEWVTERC